MREIKFRAWDKTKKEMRYFTNSKDGILYQNGKLYASTGWDGHGEPTFGYGSDHYIFEQYTGLKDENGVEIYEGDIVNLDDDEKGIVIWDEEKAKFEIKEFYDGSQDCPCCAFSEHFPFELIGSIHDKE